MRHPLRIESRPSDGSGGDDCTVRFCLFENIVGVGITFYQPDDPENIGRPLVERNIFRNSPRVYVNGAEALSLYAGGKNLGRKLNATVQFNLFDNWDGDNEIITTKSGGNRIQDNTFV